VACSRLDDAVGIPRTGVACARLDDGDGVGILRTGSTVPRSNTHSDFLAAVSERLSLPTGGATFWLHPLSYSNRIVRSDRVPVA
jgi:hypothetical protein